MSALHAELWNVVGGPLEDAKQYYYSLTTKSPIAWLDNALPLRPTLYLGLAIVFCLWLVIKLLSRPALQICCFHVPPSTLTLEKNVPLKVAERKPGGTALHFLYHFSCPIVLLLISSVWIPSSFQRPVAQPYPSWSLCTTAPLPYRPFRYGPKYNITMGLRTMQWDDWIELDNQYLKYHSLKAARIVERGEACCRTAPEAWPAAVELLEELCTYLPQRYPTIFQHLGAGKTGLKNLATGELLDIKQRLESDREDPMQVCARLVQDDLAIMIEVLLFTLHAWLYNYQAKVPRSDQTANTTFLPALSYSLGSGASKTNLACPYRRSIPRETYHNIKRNWKRVC